MQLRKKYLFIVLLVCLVGGLFTVEKIVQKKEKELKEPFEAAPITTPENENELGKFRELQMIYYGKNEKYRLETNLDSIVQENNGNMNFQGLKANLIQGNETLQEFQTKQGWLLNDEGVIHLNGPVVFKAGNYQLSVNNVNIDLNKGFFKAHGAIALVTPDMEVHAGEMDSDFQLKQVHFSGRPRVIIKKDG